MNILIFTNIKNRVNEILTLQRFRIWDDVELIRKTPWEDCEGDVTNAEIGTQGRILQHLLGYENIYIVQTTEGIEYTWNACDCKLIKREN